MMTAGRWRTVWQGARLGFVFVQRRKLCYYRRLEYDFLAFFCALLPTSLFRHVHSTIFVFLRLCSSHQLLYTLTKYVRSNLKITITTITTPTNNKNATKRWVEVFVINLSTTMQQYIWSSDMTHFLNRIFLICGRPLYTLTKYVVTWR